MVQFYPWFKFYFPSFQTHYHTLPYPKTKEIKFKPRIKLNHNICTFLYLFICLFFYLVSSIEQYLLFFESSGLIEASFHERNRGKKYNYTSIQFTISTNSGLKDKTIKSVILLFLFYLYRGYYMAARGYEFYLRVLKVS